MKTRSEHQAHVISLYSEIEDLKKEIVEQFKETGMQWSQDSYVHEIQEQACQTIEYGIVSCGS
jgi:hypothetical protein